MTGLATLTPVVTCLIMCEALLVQGFTKHNPLSRSKAVSNTESTRASVQRQLSASGIYSIVNRLNGKRYIGSTNCLAQRWREHRRLLRLNKHHCRHLQAAWNKYGPEAFKFVVLEIIAEPFLLDIEQRYLDRNKGGYNTAKFADAPHRGARASAETRAKMSEAHIGRIHSAETKAKICQAATGKGHSPETREKLRALRKGSVHTAEARAKMRAAAYRRLHKQEGAF